jgi:hypothetical protein
VDVKVEEAVTKGMRTVCAAGALAVLGSGLWMSGCNSAPELTKTNAQTLIQSDYDKRPAEPATIAVDDAGLKQGLNAKLWKLVKVYPNNRWADYTLTDEGKKAVIKQRMLTILRMTWWRMCKRQRARGLRRYTTGRESRTRCRTSRTTRSTG